MSKSANYKTTLKGKKKIKYSDKLSKAGLSVITEESFDLENVKSSTACYQMNHMK